MFGYVRANTAELKVKEYEMYRGAYCGLCRAMGKCTGQCSRMTLSYDFAFLVLLRVCLEDIQIKFSSRRCIAHPLKKRSMMERNDVLDYCARAAALLNYHKIKDDLSDEKGIKKVRAVLAFPFVSHGRKKALKAGLGELDNRISEGLSTLSAKEESELVSVDEPANVFGDILSQILSFGLEGSRARIAAEIGKSVGKWIYIVDALDDMTEDMERKRYNPFLLLYSGRLPFREELLLVQDALKAGLCSAEAAFDLIETERTAIKNIIANIMFLGLPDTAEDAIKSGLKEENKKGSKEKNERSL